MQFFGHHLCPVFPSVPSNDLYATNFGGSVIVLGAGVAGLSAAMSLKRMGVQNIVVLEASDSVGGRLKATPTDSFLDKGGCPPLDLGAEWIHSTKGAEVLRSITHFDGDESAALPELMPYKPTMYFRTNKSRMMTWLYEETKFRSTTWYQWFHSNLYERVKECVELNCPVAGINYSSSRVSLTLKDGSVRIADRVICTAPLAVLRDDIIQFDPPLPTQMKDAIQAIDMPPGFRIFFQMQERFYGDLSSYGTMFDLVKDADDVTIMYDPLLGKGIEGKDFNVLAYVSIGKKGAGGMSLLSDEELAKAALERVDEIYGGQGSKNLVGAPIVQNWTAEPYIRGAYTFPCKPKDRHELGKPLPVDDGTKLLFFAGEHTSPKHYSLVPGAACEGRRAALEVLASLGPRGDKK